uniref:Large ribosomal subunit protein uL22c n=1 Tax=Sciadopitys verticillata TaxID=28979 RepID=A0A140H9D3_SCIVE|nr:ribosomal protein L22 [Sciadopitys verticillata]AMO00755.1 ribosomal protein L22 [Sciadopitys verticillata]BAW34552.1 ribosomal protein L22 [Sciadopitys verticillata]BCK60721.1 ribosomal protein L22 [Sciadopitys verticillata]
MVNKSPSLEIRAIAKHIRISAHKARRVINLIRGASYEQTLILLELLPYGACYPILQVIYSAAANATHNMGSNKADLFVSRAEVNEGTPLKKIQPRARGRGYPIQKPTCHITIILEEM